MKFGIIGCGMVGGALMRWLHGQGRQAVGYDPDKGMTDLEGMRSADVVFVCVPTPSGPHGEMEDSYLRSAIQLLEGLYKIVVIKSTVLPGTTNRLQKDYPSLRILFNPEFLSENTADEDMARPARQIVGYTDGNEVLASEILKELPSASYSMTMHAKEAEMVKYFSNAFYALKVSYANQMYDLCQAMGVNYDMVRSAARNDPMIGIEHLSIHHKGYRGYGGKCLPKDVKAIRYLARHAGVCLSLLDTAEVYNGILKENHHG